MKIIAKREAILSPLQAVIGVVERKQTMPILANVLLSAKGGKLSITATDLEVELVATSDVDVQRGGEITVPGRKLLDICRALPESTEITLTLEGERMLVRARKSRFTLSTLPAAEFPTVEATLHFISHSLGAMPRGAEESLRRYADTWKARSIRAWEEQWFELPARLRAG